MINWELTKFETPLPGKEFVARCKKPLITEMSKQCRIFKFGPSFSQERIKSDLLADGFTLWAYV